MTPVGLDPSTGEQTIVRQPVVTIAPTEQSSAPCGRAMYQCCAGRKPAMECPIHSPEPKTHIRLTPIAHPSIAFIEPAYREECRLPERHVARFEELNVPFVGVVGEGDEGACIRKVPWPPLMVNERVLVKSEKSGVFE